MTNSSEILDRLPPHDLEAEMSLLGSLLIAPSKLDEIAPLVRPADFYADAHHRIYARMLHLHQAGKRLDRVLLRNALLATHEHETVGGDAYLAELAMAVPTASNVAEYAALVLSASKLRLTITASKRMLQDAFDRKDPSEVIAAANESLAKLAAIDGPSSTTLRQAAHRYAERCEKGDLFVELGQPDVEYALAGGVQEGEFVVIAARPSHGKTAFALQIIHHLTSQGTPTVMISEEMSALMLGKRAVQFASSVPQEHWRVNRHLVAKQLDEHFDQRAECMIFEGCRSTDRAIAAIRYAMKSHGAKVAVVDYAQMLSSAGRSRYEQVTATSIALKQLVKETGITLFVLCQLNREIEKRTLFVPQNSDLKESGQIEQDADVILHLVWPWKIDEKANPHEFLVFVGKNRNGAIRQRCVKCCFLPSRQKVLDNPAKPNTAPKVIKEQDEYARELWMGN